MQQQAGDRLALPTSAPSPVSDRAAALIALPFELTPPPSADIMHMCTSNRIALDVTFSHPQQSLERGGSPLSYPATPPIPERIVSLPHGARDVPVVQLVQGSARIQKGQIPMKANPPHWFPSPCCSAWTCPSCDSGPGTSSSYASASVSTGSSWKTWNLTNLVENYWKGEDLNSSHVRGGEFAGMKERC